MISGSHQYEEPQFYGGIIADPMGLDKTLTMIALKAEYGTQTSPLFAVRWKTIILDEAHYIRNESSRMARADRLSDLATIVKFFRVHPYTDTRQFDTDLSQLWKPKGTIDLHLRHDKLCPIDFAREERVVYDKI
ncbi:hypothetical protein CGRA01v4_01661 [Colletotrichum graminicola]|nr:hypothetical protein CGRA01v4_01661 [Colletotrichum graminicola]